MSKKLQIIVAGETGNGKSTMMYEIHRLLKSNGYNVEVSVEDDYDFKDEVDFKNKMSRYYNERINMLKTVEIVIKGEQLVRGSLTK